MTLRNSFVNPTSALRYACKIIRHPPPGCLKDPSQQNTKVEKSKNMNHELSKTSKIIKNGPLSMILHAFEHSNKNAKIQKKITSFTAIKKNIAL